MNLPIFRAMLVPMLPLNRVCTMNTRQLYKYTYTFILCVYVVVVTFSFFSKFMCRFVEHEQRALPTGFKIPISVRSHSRNHRPCLQFYSSPHSALARLQLPSFRSQGISECVSEHQYNDAYRGAHTIEHLPRLWSYCYWTFAGRYAFIVRSHDIMITMIYITSLMTW